MKYVREGEQLIQLSRQQATDGGVLFLANAKSLEISWRHRETKPHQHYYFLPNQFDPVTIRSVRVEEDGF